MVVCVCVRGRACGVGGGGGVGGEGALAPRSGWCRPSTKHLFFEDQILRNILKIINTLVSHHNPMYR